MSDKKSRKELLKQQDAFVTAAADSAAWLKGHRALVLLSVVGLLVVSVGLWSIVEYFDSRDRKASLLYSQALEVGDAEVTANPLAPSEAKPGVQTFASKEEKLKAERDAFAKVVAAAPGSGVANLARFYVADLDSKVGEADKALASFEELAGKLSADDNLYFLAIERAAYLREQKGDLDGAIAAWQHLAGGGKRFYADHALYNLARLYNVKGDVPKARELLGRFEKEFTSSSLREDAEQLYAAVGREPKPASTAAPAGQEPKATP